MPSAERIEFPDYVDKNDLHQRMAELAKAGLDRKLLLLLGAGFSKDARGYPTGAELAESLVRGTYSGYSAAEIQAAANKYELAAISQQFVEKATGKAPALLKLVQDHLSKRPPTKSATETDLATIASLCRMRRIFTTNFDEIIEQSLGTRHRFVKPAIANIQDFEAEADLLDITGVFHLNGDLSAPRMTEDDLRTHRSVFFELLRQDMLTKVLVMIGYSFRDDSITQIYDQLFDLLRSVGEDRKSYIVMPMDGKLDYKLAERLWDARGNIVVIPLRAGDFLHLLLSHIEEVRYDVVVKGLATELGESEVAVNERLNPLKHLFAHLTLGEVAEALRQFTKLRDV
jgi:hypothetical protein